jgi:carnitine O-acetyltransferase
MQSTVKRHSWCHGKELVENADFCLRMETALEFARQHIAGHRLALMDFRDFGKNTLKQFRVSPDSFVQCALQLAFWRDQGGRVTATYETGTTRAFYHGRTECIRPLTIASREMVGLMDWDSGATQQERHAALMASFKAHGAYLRKACVGMGIDRHLLAMRVIAMTAQQQDPNAEVPALFTDPAFEKMNTFELSTSAMPVTHYKDFLGFGAPFSFSYGCCYTMSSDKCLMTITGNASCEGKDVDRFKGHVEQAMRDLVQVLRDGSGAEVHAKL